MSAFEVIITPPRFRCTKQNESREPTIVVMAPFSAKATVQFEDVPVSKVANRILRIQNPTDEDIMVKVTKDIHEAYNLAIDWTENVVPAQGEIEMKMSWCPTIELVTKETLQLTDSRNFRKDVMVIMKSQCNKPKSKYPTLSTGNRSKGVTTVLRLKSPTAAVKHKVPAKSQRTQGAVNKSIRKTAAVATTAIGKRPAWKPVALPISSSKNRRRTETQWQQQEQQQMQHLPQQLQELPQQRHSIAAPLEKHTNNAFLKVKNFARTSHLNSPNNSADCSESKENISPQTPSPSNMLNKIDQLKFTPLTATKNTPLQVLENLASWPTPVCAVEPNVETTLQMEYNTVPKLEMRPRRLTAAEYEDQEVAELMSNKTFELSRCSILEESCQDGRNTPQLTLNRTTVIAVPTFPHQLERIQEEEDQQNATYCKTSDGNVTVGTNLIRDVKLIGTPLRKHAESMRNLSVSSPQAKFGIQGSMPNLNEMENLNSIEQNRYYYSNNQSGNTATATSNKSLLPDESAVMLERTRVIISPYKKWNYSNSNGKQLEKEETLDAPNAMQCSLFNLNEIKAQSSRFNLHELSLTANGNRSSVNSSPSSTSKLAGKKRFSSELSLSDAQSTESVVNSDHLKKPIQTSAVNKKSPPKRQRLDNEFNFLRPSPTSRTSVRAKTWSRVQPKTLKLSKTLSLMCTPITPTKLKSKPRIKLYDSDTFLTSFINPDPFAASTTCDPFLAATMYLDEESVDKHQTDFIKWLNALVTVPADLDADCDAKIDFGKLFNEVRHKDVTLAPTKEEQSMNYLTSTRLETLRRAAIELFMSEQLRVPCSRVAVYVNKNAITIRNDRNLHLDVVMQRNILELLLCFNPLWLRLGLEVVFGEKIHMQSNKDIVGLSAFILTRLFRDKFLEQKYSRAYSLSEEYANHIKKFTLQKVLFLLLFLDKAKTERIIKHNPCLFTKNSVHKETKEILLKFSAELLSNIGDITRVLKRMGYMLQHKQSYLDEFDYAFKNVAVDLRDGVRLTRVMEIILLRDDLSKLLRVPAISRLQRIYNVNLALKALAEADFQLSGEITAADIVDGHREKTLSLLWQLIYKFRAPKFHAAAKVIQQWWRYKLLKVIIQRRIREKLQRRLNVAASKMQALWRGYVARKYALAYRQQRTQAVIVLQKYMRGVLARRRYKLQLLAVVLIQRQYRAVLQGRKLRQQYVQLRTKALIIQRWFRRQLMLSKLQRMQTYFYELCDQRRQTAASTLQTWWRQQLLLRKERQQFLLLRQSAVIIQTHWRGRLAMLKARQQFCVLRTCVLQMQQRYRAMRSMRQQRALYASQRQCIIRMQQLWRGNKLCQLQRQIFLRQKRAAIVLQRRWRAQVHMRKATAHYQQLRAAATKLQQRYKAKRVMRCQREKYAQTLKLIRKVQQRFKAKLLCRKERALYVLQRNSIITIQLRWRATLLMHQDRLYYAQLRQASICIQRRYRNKLDMMRPRQAYLQLRQAAMVMQNRYRARLSMRQAQCAYQTLRTAVTLVQQRYRAKLQGQQDKAHYLRKVKAIIFVQQRFRAKMCARATRSQYLQQRTLVIKLQQRWRATRKMKTEHAYYLELRTATLQLQARYRALRLMQQQRAKYLAYRKAALSLQTYFRAHLAKCQAQAVYQRLKQAVILTQRRYRAKLLMRQERCNYQRTLVVVKKLQQRFRATQLARQQRACYIRERNSIVKLQQRWRATLRMRTERVAYTQLRLAAIVIQTRYRAKCVMQRQRLQYQQLRLGCIYVQQKFRGKTRMLMQRHHFQLLRNSLPKFQAQARGYLARSRFQMLITPEMIAMRARKKAAILIQRHWRGYRVRRSIKNSRLIAVSHNIAKLKKKSNPLNSLRHKMLESVKVLRGRYSLAETLNMLMRLDRISRTVPHLIIEPEFISIFCYGIMAQAIRSEIDKQMIEYCSRIILNLARYDKCSTNIFQQRGLVTIAQMLLRWCDKDCDIFNTLCTLIWVFAQCPKRKKIIYNFMTTADATYTLREIKKLVARKEKMKQNVRKPSVMVNRNAPKQFSSRALPSLMPDYGTVRDKPYIFISSVYAFDTILLKLGIQIF